jgi:hypothetical protein
MAPLVGTSYAHREHNRLWHKAPKTPCRVRALIQVAVKPDDVQSSQVEKIPKQSFDAETDLAFSDIR